MRYNVMPVMLSETETSLIYHFHALPNKRLELFRFAQNDSAA
jgi:hypothetical protein